MADVVSAAVRSRMMSGIKGKNSRPEIMIRRILFAKGYRFRLHRLDLPGKPDIVMQGRKIAIFVHGCFWHAHEGCKYFKMPKTRPEFWTEKLQSNVERDQKSVAKLMDMGWRVLCIWECATRNHATVDSLGENISLWIAGDKRFAEIAGPTSSETNCSESTIIPTFEEAKNL